MVAMVLSGRRSGARLRITLTNSASTSARLAVCVAAAPDTSLSTTSRCERVRSRVCACRRVHALVCVCVSGSLKVTRTYVFLHSDHRICAQTCLHVYNMDRRSTTRFTARTRCRQGPRFRASNPFAGCTA